MPRSKTQPTRHANLPGQDMWGTRAMTTAETVREQRANDESTDNTPPQTNQKGFLSVDGCMEHIFLLPSMLQHSRRHRKYITIVWLDLKDTFGSVPHSVLFETLGQAGLNRKTLQERLSTQTQSFSTLRSVNTARGCYRPGPKQVQSLAYSNDLCLFAQSKENILTMLGAIHQLNSWEGLTISLGKCASLTCVNPAFYRYEDTFSHLLGDHHILSFSLSYLLTCMHVLCHCSVFLLRLEKGLND